MELEVQVNHIAIATLINYVADQAVASPPPTGVKMEALDLQEPMEAVDPRLVAIHILEALESTIHQTVEMEGTVVAAAAAAAAVAESAEMTVAIVLAVLAAEEEEAVKVAEQPQEEPGLMDHSQYGLTIPIILL